MAAKQTEPEWKDIDADRYRQVAGASVHFSTKGVNSNADAGGVRLDANAGLPLPYVSVRTLMAHGIHVATDYTKNVGNVATVMKQIRLLAADQTTLDPADAQALSATIAAAQAGAYTEGLDAVSPRLRQLLMPKDDGYVAFTPLPSGGLSQIINARIAAFNEDKTHPPIRLATLGVGGAKPVNVGALVRHMQTAAYFAAPREDLAIRAALAIHYRGLRLKLPYSPMLAWRQWREQAKARHQGAISTDMDSRVTEQALILAISRAMLRQGARARRRLQDHLAILPQGQYLSPELNDPVTRGLIDPEERSRDWPRQYGEQLSRLIGAYSFGTEAGVEPLDDGSLQWIARWIAESVW